MPSPQTISARDRKFEREELRFQKAVNGITFLSWTQLRNRVDPAKTYQVTEPGGRRQVFTGQDLLDKAHHRVTGSHSCTYITKVKEVSQGFQQPNSDLWETYRDRKTRKLMVTNHDEDVWETDKFTRHWATAEEARNFPMEDRSAEGLAEDLTARRGEQRDLSDARALQTAKEAAKATIKLAFAVNMTQGMEPKTAITWAVGTATEALDRAYGRERMRNHGIDIADHPELNTYQYFFDLGWAPPTHEQMADYIIREYGRKQEPEGAAQ